MGNWSSSSDKQRLFCGPPGQLFLHWQLVKLENGNGYHFVPVYKSAVNNLPSMWVDSVTERDVFLDSEVSCDQYFEKKRKLSNRSGSR